MFIMDSFIFERIVYRELDILQLSFSPKQNHRSEFNFINFIYKITT